MILKRYLVLVVLCLFIASCGSRKKVVTRKKEMTERRGNQTMSGADNEINQSLRTRDFTVENYIEDYALIAQEEMQLYKIPASITLAQGILESGSGKGRLARMANNHFGIKCHDWEGEKIYHDDDRSQECFRKYLHPRYSFRDHSLFLSRRSRYAALFRLDPDDYKGWAKGLRRAGYATDRRYPEKLIELIERYQLYRYDSGVINNSLPELTTAIESGEEYYTVRKGDTLYSIAKHFNITVERLQNMNGLNGTIISIGQNLIVK